MFHSSSLEPKKAACSHTSMGTSRGIKGKAIVIEICNFYQKFIKGYNNKRAIDTDAKGGFMQNAN